MPDTAIYTCLRGLQRLSNTHALPKFAPETLDCQISVTA